MDGCARNTHARMQAHRVASQQHNCITGHRPSLPHWRFPGGEGLLLQPYGAFGNYKYENLPMPASSPRDHIDRVTAGQS